ncbi:MAG: pilus assembly protein PilP [Candidatus Accumulibacter sp.]|jgi:type IV pilus assembly protein PilP|nr:pilus assembly protein PilP [Accumulibacter sp.]
MKKLLIPFCCVVLAACSADSDHEDLAQWMNESSRGLRGKVSPLPQVEPYEPVAYDAANMLDPFKASKIIPERTQGGGGKLPDFDRPREPLESYPLESLRYVGVIMRENEAYALILADRSLYQVGAGNYLGQNFGRITKVDESEVSLMELVQDAAGDWIERTSSLHLQGTGQEMMK